MSGNISPPPTWADPVDKKTGGFSPPWLQWFLSVAYLLNQTQGGSTGIQHNDLQGLQGGAANEYYHLSLAQITLLGGLGTMAAQNSNSVTITGGSINGTTIGAGTASTVRASTLTQQEAATLIHTINALTNGAGSSAGTLTNAPAAGNPTKWISIDDAGTTRKIPCW